MEVFGGKKEADLVLFEKEFNALGEAIDCLIFLLHHLLQVNGRLLYDNSMCSSVFCGVCIDLT